MENEIKLKEIEEKYKLEESKLNNELSTLKKIQNELMEFALNKSKIKKEINILKNRIQISQKEKKTNSLQ